jgi:UDP-N-acetylglucosamine--N-acetylmuramyl-(pentapeptide) pyrophosphoryl-undecaprenol N-acetylglucosamine transferase
VITGNPVRPAIASVQRRVESPPCVAVVGGSLGAHSLNAASLELYDRWRDRGDVVVLHVSGRREFDECTERHRALQRPDDRLRYELVAFEDHMERVYASAAVAVCRAGAITVAELASVGLPAVLVPLPHAPADHQTKNARSLVDAGAGVLVADDELDGDRLARELDALLGDPERLTAMSAAARSIARPDAARRVADLVEEAARVAA